MLRIAPARFRFALVPLAFTIGVAMAPLGVAQQPPPSAARPSRCSPPISRRGRTSANRACRTTANGSSTCSRPNEGDATLIIRSTGADAKETKFPIGEAGGGGGGRGGAPGGGSSLTISGDSRWVAFTIYPPSTTPGAVVAARRGGRGARRRRRRRRPAPTQNKMALVNLATGEKKEFDKVRRFSFNGDKPT